MLAAGPAKERVGLAILFGPFASFASIPSSEAARTDTGNPPKWEAVPLGEGEEEDVGDGDGDGDGD